MYRVQAQQGSPVILRYRVVKGDGTLLLPGDVSSMTLYVYCTDGTETTPSGGVALTVANVVQTTVQPWNVDGVGWNVSVEVAGTYLPDYSTAYRCEVLVTPVSYLPFYLETCEVSTIQTFSIAGV